MQAWRRTQLLLGLDLGEQHAAGFGAAAGQGRLHPDPAAKGARWAYRAPPTRSPCQGARVHTVSDRNLSLLHSTVPSPDKAVLAHPAASGLDGTWEDIPGAVRPRAAQLSRQRRVKSVGRLELTPTRVHHVVGAVDLYHSNTPSPGRARSSLVRWTSLHTTRTSRRWSPAQRSRCRSGTPRPVAADELGPWR